MTLETKGFWDSHANGFEQIDTTNDESLVKSYDAYESTRYKTTPVTEQWFDEAIKGTEKLYLEVGTGIGSDFRKAARKVPNAVGIDLSYGNLKLASRALNASGLLRDLVNASAEAIPFRGEVFDTVYSNGVLHHTPDTSRAVKEVHRVMVRSGDKFYCMLYHRWSATRLNTVAALLITIYLYLIHSAPIRSPGDDPSPIEKSYTKREVKKMFLPPFSSLEMRFEQPTDPNKKVDFMTRSFYLMQRVLRRISRSGSLMLITATG